MRSPRSGQERARDRFWDHIGVLCGTRHKVTYPVTTGVLPALVAATLLPIRPSTNFKGGDGRLDAREREGKARM